MRIYELVPVNLYPVMLDTEEKLESENEALIMDVAFYGGSVTNLSCEDK